MIFRPDDRKPYQQPDVTTVYELLTLRAEKNPDAHAITAPGRSPLTYGSLVGAVTRTVGYLRAVGVERNDRVAIVLPNGPEVATAFLGVAAAATCAPLNPAYRARELEFYLTDLNARALIVRSGMESAAREVARRHDIPIIELTPILEAEAGVFELTGPAPRASAPDDFAQRDDIALVLHTSGTTSRPKLVPLTQSNLCSSGHNIALTLELGEADRCLNVMPLFHIHGLVGAVLSSLTAGASIVCTPGLDAARFFEWLEAFQPTWYTAVPTMHHAIVARASAHREIIGARRLRFIRSSSASLPARVMAALEDTFEAPVIEAYGMTEAAHQMTSNPLPPARRKAGSVGIAAGPDVAIMDEGGNLLPVGEVGEVVIRGPNVMSGYEHDGAANQRAFTGGWFRTGDQGRFDTDGYLHLTGRLKEIVNRGGEKIALKEVDDVLLQHPDVVQAVAFAMPHATLGEDLAAAVVLNDGAAATERDLRDFTAARLAEFKVPSQVLVVDALPKGPTGKLQRTGLADALGVKRRTDFVAPQTPIEQALTDMWRDLLQVDRVGVHDNFYALGGDSLALAGMMIEIEDRFATALPVDEFLRSPTIATIARLVDKDAPSTASGAAMRVRAARPTPIRDALAVGVKNRLLQVLALYAPGYTTTRVWLHRLRGVSIGRNVSIGLSVLIETAYPRLVRIGNNVTIGMRAVIIGHLRDLTTDARASHEPTVRIEDDVYIGPGVIVLPNVTIGRGAVVSAGSVVSSSVPPRTLVRGNPATPVARCGVSLGGGVAYEEFLRHLTPIHKAGRRRDVSRGTPRGEERHGTGD